MLITQKCQYALRAVFELSRRDSRRPAKISEIAEAQAIPARFLEVILSQLKQAGFVKSQRGNKGGYSLIRSPGELTVGEVIRFMQGSVGPVECLASGSKDKCPFYGDCVFLPMWEKARDAILGVYDNTTFQNLVDHERQKAGKFALCYAI